MNCKLQAKLWRLRRLIRASCHPTMVLAAASKANAQFSSARLKKNKLHMSELLADFLYIVTGDG